MTEQFPRDHQPGRSFVAVELPAGGGSKVCEGSLAGVFDALQVLQKRINIPNEICSTLACFSRGLEASIGKSDVPPPDTALPLESARYVMPELSRDHIVRAYFLQIVAFCRLSRSRTKAGI